MTPAFRKINEVRAAINSFGRRGGLDSQLAVEGLTLLLQKLERAERKKAREQDELHRPLEVRICDRLFRSPGTTEKQLAAEMKMPEAVLMRELKRLNKLGAVGWQAIGKEDQEIHYPNRDRLMLHCAAGVPGMTAR